MGPSRWTAWQEKPAQKDGMHEDTCVHDLMGPIGSWIQDLRDQLDEAWWSTWGLYYGIVYMISARGDPISLMASCTWSRRLSFIQPSTRCKCTSEIRLSCTSEYRWSILIWDVVSESLDHIGDPIWDSVVVFKWVHMKMCTLYWVVHR